jgi:pimeloyl-ACP methyl ester carboxylesterase
MARIPQLIEHNSPARIRAVILVLPGGLGVSTGRYLPVAEWGLRPLLARLIPAGTKAGVSVQLLRYRMRGWNGDAADTLTDTRWALDRITSHHGSVPVLLVGNSLGGRAAFRAAGHEQVAGIAGIAPWLPEGEPVRQLAGREVLILHGDRDDTDAGARYSLSYARRARQWVPDLARIEIPGGSHLLVRGARDCAAMCTEFAMSVTAGVPRGTLLERARGGNLRTVLPPGYRASRGDRAGATAGLGEQAGQQRVDDRLGEHDGRAGPRRLLLEAVEEGSLETRAEQRERRSVAVGARADLSALLLGAQHRGYRQDRPLRASVVDLQHGAVRGEQLGF